MSVCCSSRASCSRFSSLVSSSSLGRCSWYREAKILRVLSESVYLTAASFLFAQSRRPIGGASSWRIISAL